MKHYSICWPREFLKYRILTGREGVGLDIVSSGNDIKMSGK